MRSCHHAFRVVSNKIRVILLHDGQTHKGEKMIDAGPLLLCGLVQRGALLPATLFVDLMQQAPSGLKKLSQGFFAVEEPFPFFPVQHATLLQDPVHDFWHDLDVLAHGSLTDDFAFIPILRVRCVCVCMRVDVSMEG